MQIAKLTKDISRIETEKYNLSAQLEKLEFKQMRASESNFDGKLTTQTAQKELEADRAKTTAALNEAKSEVKKLKNALAEVMKIVDQVVRQVLEVDLMNEYAYLFSNGETELSEQNLT